MYHRTQNENGSFNSRCLDCFLTIAFCVVSEKELDRLEAEHLCLEKVLAQLYAAQHPTGTHAARH
ncbi:MAG TPA: hypothetical protein VGR47_09025 [Terracidiphilus sp.]|nr:hypothetical protein [Terracidiphilus sp.]